MPFLNRLADAMSSFRMAFNYFALNLQNRESVDSEDRRRLEGVERSIGASFPTGFPDQLVAYLKQHAQAQAPRRRAHPTGAAVTRPAPPLRLVRRPTA